jgi:hypothetical protein
MADVQIGNITAGDGPSGNRGIPTTEGLTEFADDVARNAFVQIATDRGRNAFQVAGLDPGWYKADGLGNWLYLGDPTVGDNVYGEFYQTAISLPRTTTGLLTPQLKVALVVPARTGIMRVGWCATVDQSATNRQVQARLQNITDVVTVGDPHLETPSASADRMKIGGFAEVVFAGAGKTFEIQFNALVSGTAGIADARIEIWRVS